MVLDRCFTRIFFVVFYLVLTEIHEAYQKKSHTQNCKTSQGKKSFGHLVVFLSGLRHSHRPLYVACLMFAF